MVGFNTGKGPKFRIFFPAGIFIVPFRNPNAVNCEVPVLNTGSYQDPSSFPRMFQIRNM